MLTVVAAAAIGRSCSAGNKADVESDAVIVVDGEYSIIELRIRVAMLYVFTCLGETNMNVSLYVDRMLCGSPELYIYTWEESTRSFAVNPHIHLSHLTQVISAPLINTYSQA